MTEHLRFGQRVRVRCSVTGRYIGRYGGEELALFVSAQDNDFSIDIVDRERKPHPGLPVPTDRELSAAGTGVRYGTRLGEQRSTTSVSVPTTTEGE